MGTCAGLMNERASSPAWKVQACRTSVQRSALTCQKSHVRLMRVSLRGIVYRRPESLTYSSLYDRNARAEHTERSLENTRSSVDRSSTLDMSLSTWGGSTRFMPRALPWRRCCFVNYKLPDRRSHAHGGGAYPIALIEVSADTPGWYGAGGAVRRGFGAGCGHPVNFALKQISSIILQDAPREEVWGATSFTTLADKCYRAVTNCAQYFTFYPM